MADGSERGASQRRRIRQQERRSASVTSSAWAALVLILAPGLFRAVAPDPVLALPSIEASLSLSAGHDDQILAEPERRGLLEALAEDFGTASGRIVLGWNKIPLADEVQILGEASGTRYGSQQVGDDAGLRLSGVLRRRIAPTVLLDARGSWWQFRRQELADFNVDLSRVGGRLAWAPGPSWLVSVSGRRNWIDFPERILPPDTTFVQGDGGVTVIPVDPQSERDRQVDISFSVFRRFGAAYVAAEFGRRRSDSNIRTLAYGGPTGNLRVGRTGADGTDIAGYVGFNRRTFDELYVIASPATGDPVTEERSDRAIQFGFAFERPVMDGVRVFGDGSWMDQSSSIDDFSFDHARFALGVTVDLRSRRRGGFPTQKPPLAPRQTARGVQFRILAQGAAEVSVVGDFNGWDTGRGICVPLGEGVWEAVIPVGEGIWRYAFVVDQVWTRPPDASRYESDGFGGENGVLEVSSPEHGDVTPGAPRRPNAEKTGGSEEGGSPPGSPSDDPDR